MISDVLSETVIKLTEYLEEPIYAKTYTAEDRLAVAEIISRCEALRMKLDTPPIRQEAALAAAGGTLGTVQNTDQALGTLPGTAGVVDEEAALAFGGETIESATPDMPIGRIPRSPALDSLEE